jgi:predicted transcriptional regulator
MTDILVYAALAASVISLVVMSVVLRYLPVLRKASVAYVESSDVVSSIVSEFNSRTTIQDRRLADVQIKLDVLQDRWARWGIVTSLPPPAPRQPGSGPGLADLNSRRDSSVRRSSESTEFLDLMESRLRDHNEASSRSPSRVEFRILQGLANQQLTALQVRELIGTSREHAARLMKALTEKGLVQRDASKKPYAYTLSDTGRDVVTNVRS